MLQAAQSGYAFAAYRQINTIVDSDDDCKTDGETEFQAMKASHRRSQDQRRQQGKQQPKGLTALQGGQRQQRHRSRRQGRPLAALTEMKLSLGVDPVSAALDIVATARKLRGELAKKPDAIRQSHRASAKEARNDDETA